MKYNFRSNLILGAHWLPLNLYDYYRRANFTSADMRESDFSGCTFNGAYLEKAVAYKTNFSGKLVTNYSMIMNENETTKHELVELCMA